MTHSEDNEVDDSDKDGDGVVFFYGNWFGASRQSKSDSTSAIFYVVRHMFQKNKSNSIIWFLLVKIKSSVYIVKIRNWMNLSNWTVVCIHLLAPVYSCC